MGLLRMLTDRGTEYYGKLEQHDYELYLGINEVEHTKTKTYFYKLMASVSVSTR